MKKNKNGKILILIYMLIIIALIAIIFLTKEVLSIPKPKEKEYERTVEKLDINPYPNVNEECTFNVSLSQYQSLSSAGCTGGYTRYDINDVKIDEVPIKVSVIYSDKEQRKTGLFVNDKAITTKVDSIANFKFGIFDSKLFVLDLNNSESNVLAVNQKGEKIYNLKAVLKEKKIKELATGDTTVKNKNLDPASFIFYEGGFEFNSTLSECQVGSNSKGSHYKVAYKNEKFEKPEFMNLIEC